MAQLNPNHHRSDVETKLWLRTRIWYKRYVKNLEKEIDDPDMKQDFLNGKYGARTISSAFTYRNTQEGVRYWCKKEERFLRWYYYQGKEICRCKWFTIQI